MVGCSPKGYLTAVEAAAWAARVAHQLRQRRTPGSAGMFFCPPFPLIPQLRDILFPVGVSVGAQDVSAFPPGAYTGEVSAELLAEVGVRFVIIGHPERASHLGETAAVVQRKIGLAVAAGLVPVLVIGERSPAADAVAAVRRQLEHALDGFLGGADLVVAYEPAWAIGAAAPAGADHVVRVVTAVRAMLRQVAPGARILYGGSAGAGTFTAIARAAGQNAAGRPDGVFLGRGGLDPDAFLDAVTEVVPAEIIPARRSRPRPSRSRDGRG